MWADVFRTNARPRLRSMWRSATIPLPVAMLLGAVLLALASAGPGAVFETLNKGFGNNLGYFAIVILSAFFIAGWMAERGSASLGKFGLALSPLLGAGMVCPDTAYASLAPIGGGLRKYIAVGCYSGFKLLMPAGPLIIGIGLGADTHSVRFFLEGLLLTLVTWMVGATWAYFTTHGDAAPTLPEEATDESRDPIAKVIIPLVAFFALLAIGYLVPNTQHPAAVFFTTPAGALIATSVLIAINSKPGEAQELLSKSMRRTGALLFTIGCASALGQSLGKALPKDLIEQALAGSDGTVHMLVGSFLLAALFKSLNGSSLATFAAIPPVLVPVLAGNNVDMASITFAVCLGSFVAILPNDSYFWLVKSDAFPEYPTGRYMKLMTVGSALQALIGIAVLLLITP